MPQRAHCSLLHRFVFLYLSAFVHHTPGSGNKAGVCRRSTLTGSLTPPTNNRFPLFAWDAVNARTETREAYHYTHPVSSRSAGCPLLDPSDVLARLAGRGVSSDGALLLQSRIKNVHMLINQQLPYCVFSFQSSFTRNYQSSFLAVFYSSL